VKTLADRYRTAFVTGASTGLGRAFADMLLAEGLEVWGTARDRSRLPAAPRFHAEALDLHAGEAAEQILVRAEQAAGGFDVVVNSAGYGAFGEFAGTEYAVWQRQLEAMLVNTARLAHTALRGMRARGRGALVNVSSMSVEFPLPFQSAYNMAKAGLSALSESLMTEVAGTAVIVIDLRPGDHRTDFDGSVLRTPPAFTAREARVWNAFAAMMLIGPPPAQAAAALRRALQRGRSGTVRTGRIVQTVLAPLLSRLGSDAQRRYWRERYFDARP
jgi:short-subunit dehydrogenase